MDTAGTVDIAGIAVVVAGAGAVAGRRPHDQGATETAGAELGAADTADTADGVGGVARQALRNMAVASAESSKLPHIQPGAAAAAVGNLHSKGMVRARIEQGSTTCSLGRIPEYGATAGPQPHIHAGCTALEALVLQTAEESVEMCEPVTEMSGWPWPLPK